MGKVYVSFLVEDGLDSHDELSRRVASWLLSGSAPPSGLTLSNLEIAPPEHTTLSPHSAKHRLKAP